MTSTDVGALARLHGQAFPNFFLSTLGEPFLVQFYRGFLQDDTAVTVVARDGCGAPLGAVVGTTQPSKFFVRLLKRRWPSFVLASARAVLRNPRSAPRLIRAVTYRGGTVEGMGGALLCSICVSPCLQGGGVGRQLIDEWSRVALSRGAKQASLTTDATGNEAVNRFYRADGWTLADTHQTSEGRSMNRYTKRLATR